MDMGLYWVGLRWSVKSDVGQSLGRSWGGVWTWVGWNGCIDVGVEKVGLGVGMGRRMWWCGHE